MVDRNEVEQVVVIIFSRIARSTSHLLKALKTFKERNARFISFTESIDISSPLSVALYTLTGQSILGASARMRDDLREFRAGMKNAKAKGRPREN